MTAPADRVRLNAIRCHRSLSVPAGSNVPIAEDRYRHRRGRAAVAVIRDEKAKEKYFRKQSPEQVRAV